MFMKIAVSGKGGVGKSTVSAVLVSMLAKRGGRVLALDADPDANLAVALGMSREEREKIVPISKQIELIEERTGVEIREYGKVFKLNPDVTDVAEKFGTPYNGVNLLVLGAIQNGGGGCACPESTFIRALVTDLVLYKDDALVMDMEAGIEHLGRATSGGVDMMLIVVEPGWRSIECAQTITRMSGEIGIRRVLYIGNKVKNNEDKDFILENVPSGVVSAWIPYSESVREADLRGTPVADNLDAETIAGIMNAVCEEAGK